MAISRCPGQDMRVWNTKDVYEVQCQNCGTEVEFWKDDQSHQCPNCSQTITNPRFSPTAQQENAPEGT